MVHREARGSQKFWKLVPEEGHGYRDGDQWMRRAEGELRPCVWVGGPGADEKAETKKLWL